MVPSIRQRLTIVVERSATVLPTRRRARVVQYLFRHGRLNIFLHALASAILKVAMRRRACLEDVSQSLFLRRNTQSDRAATC